MSLRWINTEKYSSFFFALQRTLSLGSYVFQRRRGEAGVPTCFPSHTFPNPTLFHGTSLFLLVTWREITRGGSCIHFPGLLFPAMLGCCGVGPQVAWVCSASVINLPWGISLHSPGLLGVGACRGQSAPTPTLCGSPAGWKQRETVASDWENDALTWNCRNMKLWFSPGGNLLFRGRLAMPGDFFWLSHLDWGGAVSI